MPRVLRAFAVLAVIGVAWLLAWRSAQRVEIAGRAQREAEAARATAARQDALRAADGVEPGAPMRVLLRVEPAVLDCGDLVPDVLTTRTVTLRNLTDQPVRVVRAVSECGCTAPNAPQDPIPASGSVQAEIQIRPGATQGERLSKRVTFEVAGGLPASCMVQGVGGIYLQFAPTTLQAPADDVAEPPPGEITLESRVGVHFEITEVDPSIEQDAPSRPDLRQVVRIDWKLWREAGRPMQVRIVTDHAGAPPITVVLRRHG